MNIVKQMQQASTPEFIILGARLNDIACSFFSKNKFGADDLLPILIKLMSVDCYQLKKNEIDNYEGLIKKHLLSLSGSGLLVFTLVNIFSAASKIAQLTNFIVTWCDDNQLAVIKKFKANKMTLGELMKLLEEKLTLEQKQELSQYIESQEMQRPSTSSTQTAESGESSASAISEKSEQVDKTLVSSSSSYSLHDIFGDSSMYKEDIVDNFVIAPDSQQSFRNKQYLYPILLEELSAYPELAEELEPLHVYESELNEHVFEPILESHEKETENKIMGDYKSILDNTQPWVKTIFKLVEDYPGIIPDIARLLNLLNIKKQLNGKIEVKNDEEFAFLTKPDDVKSKIKELKSEISKIHVKAINQVSREYINGLKYSVGNCKLAAQKIEIVTEALRKLNQPGDLSTRISLFKAHLLENQEILKQERPTLWAKLWQNLKPYLGIKSKSTLTTGAKLHVLADQSTFKKSTPKLRDLKQIKNVVEEVELPEVNPSKKP